jgi:prepilin-type N-terminal cleavage/methylation domain-containing protein
MRSWKREDASRRSLWHTGRKMTYQHGHSAPSRVAALVLGSGSGQFRFRKPHRCGQRGITLVELMVVVLIAGVLAMVGLGAMRRHMNASRSVEALGMIQSTRGAEERYRAIQMQYLDVSSGGDLGWYPRNPTPAGGGDGSVRVPFFSPPNSATHPDNANWLVLAPTVSGPMQFGYKVNAGLPGAAMTPPNEVVTGLAWPTPTEPWYVVQAIADADSDGVTAFFLASSLNDAVYTTREGE